MWSFPQRKEGGDNEVKWSSLKWSDIHVKKWRIPTPSGALREGIKVLPSIIATETLEPGQRILCFGRILRMDPRAPSILAKRGEMDNVDLFQHSWDVSKGRTVLTLDASPILDPLVHGEHVVPGRGLFCWVNIQEPLLGHMPNVLFQVSTNWTKDNTFREVADWLRTSGNWAWFQMTESLATQLDRTVHFDDTELLYMVVVEKIEAGQHLFASRGRVIFPQLQIHRVIAVEQQLNRSPICMSQRFITMATRMMNATGFRGSLTERIAQLFVDVGKPCGADVIRSILCAWEPRSLDNQMNIVTSTLLDSLSVDLTKADVPVAISVVQLWTPAAPLHEEGTDLERIIEDEYTLWSIGRRKRAERDNSDLDALLLKF